MTSSSEPPLVSVILPVRNAEQTLGRAIQSCLAQTLSRIEVIVVLNGCFDGSEKIAEGFAKQDPRVKILFSKAQGGVAHAANQGLAHAKSGVIARMDADDVSLPTRLEKQYVTLKADPSLDLVTTQVRLMNSQGKGMERYVEWVNQQKSVADFRGMRFVESPVIQPSAMMRKTSLEQVGSYREDLAWAEDHDLWLRMLARSGRFQQVPEELFHWYDGPSRLTRTHSDYEQNAIWRMKAFYLSEELKRQGKTAVIAGAGPQGKRLALELLALKIEIEAFLEVDPRKIGKTIHGIPVHGATGFIPPHQHSLYLLCVGGIGKRKQMEKWAHQAGLRVGAGYYCCC